MKFVHLSDLHIGKRVCEHSLLEDQRYILKQIISIIEAEKPDAVLIAGDVYDKAIPSAEAISLLDDLLWDLSKSAPKTFVISGNHDSAERIAFGGRLMEERGICLSPVYNGKFTPVTMQDEFGPVDVWMLPFVRPAEVRATFEHSEAGDVLREQVVDYTTAVRAAVGQMNIQEGRRNVLVAHQFVTGAQIDENGSEEFVGGLSNVDANVFDCFDYVALGHIHRPQDIAVNEAGVGRIRYSGTPLKYSLSEADHTKSVTVVELGAKGELSLREIPLTPLHDVRQIKGTFAELMSAEFRSTQNLEDYVYVVLTDENDVADAGTKLRSVYPNFMTVDYDNTRTRSTVNLSNIKNVEKKSPMKLIEEFFVEMNGRPLNDQENQLIQNLVDSIWRV